MNDNACSTQIITTNSYIGNKIYNIYMFFYFDTK